MQKHILNSKNVGITGIRIQMFYLIVLKETLIECIRDSPIEYDETILEL